MYGDTRSTVVGEVAGEPQLTFDDNGDAVLRFMVVATPRVLDRQSGRWRNGDPLEMRCEQRRHCAENAAETLTPGMRVIVTGELCQRTYTTEHGRRTFFVLMADEIGPSLRHHTAKMMQMQRIPAGAGATSS